MIAIVPTIPEPVRDTRAYWQSLWYQDVKEPGSPESTVSFTKCNSKPPDNQAWGEYVGIRITL